MEIQKMLKIAILKGKTFSSEIFSGNFAVAKTYLNIFKLYASKNFGKKNFSREKPLAKNFRPIKTFKNNISSCHKMLAFNKRHTVNVKMWRIFHLTERNE